MSIAQASSRGKRAGLWLVLVAGLMLAACSATYDNHGYIPPQEDLDAIVPGVDTRGSVEETIGRPSAAGLVRDEAWFYVASRVRNFAYRAPEVVEREIVAISFNSAGVVENIERFGLEDGQVVPLSRRVTTSTIRDVTLLTQILRNFGRLDIGNMLGGN